MSSLREPIGPRGMMVAIDTNENTWNYFSATETITRSAGPNSAGQTNATTQSVVAVQRTLGSNNVWSTANNYNPLPSMDASGAAAPANINIAQLQTADDGSYMTVTTSDGTVVTATPDLTATYGVQAPPPGRDPIPNFPAPPPGFVGNRASGLGMSLARVAQGKPAASVDAGQAPSTPDPRAWIANLVVTPRNREAQAAARERFFGPKVGVIGQLDRYLARRDSLTFEELVDPAIGATVERNVGVNGQLRAHITRTFADLGGGRYVLSSVRYDISHGDGTPVHTTVVTYDSIRVERR